MGALVMVLFLGLSLFQMAATIGGLEAVGLHWLLAIPLAFVLGGFPVIGTVAGVWGAHASWGWSWTSALLLFFGPFLLIVALVAIAGGVDKLRGKK